MAVPVVVNRDNVSGILQIVLYFLAFLMILYAMYKLFGLFKDAGKKLEDALNKLKDSLNPSDAPGKFKQTGEDIATIITGTFTGKQNTPEYNDAMARLHYGGHEYEPGSADVDEEGNIKKYGTTVKPGETKVFHGGTYTETVVNNLVKPPHSSEPIPKEDALAMKYGFSTYAQFNAWLSGVKAALKAAGKDPSGMSLEQIVKYGRELERKKEEWRKQNPDKATPTFDTQKSTVPAYLKQFELPPEKQDEIRKMIYPRTPGGGVYVGGSTPISEIIKKRNLPKPIGKLPGVGDRHILPIFRPIYAI